MTDIAFSKFHGFGNDYIVIPRTQALATVDLKDLAAAICDRHTGVGGDGIAVINELNGQVADFNCEIVNPDGSYASFSGNGTRCAVAYLYHQKLWENQRLRLRTRSGVKVFTFLKLEAPHTYIFDAEIGRPKFASDEIPVSTPQPRDAVINEPFRLNGSEYAVSTVNVGNPVACIFVKDFEFDWRTVGRELESHARFPQRINVVFVKPIDRGNVEVRIWERGAGETSASGTCASGAAAMSAFTLKTERKVRVHSPGGTTNVEWQANDELVITGEATLAFSGLWPN